MAGRDRRGIEKQHIAVLVDHYAHREGCGFVRQDGDWYSWQCPGCGNETLRANVDWGKAGCRVEECPVPELENWQGIVGYFEGSEDFEADTERERVRKLKGVALRIVKAYEDQERQKAEAEAEAKAQRQREEQEAEQKAEAENTWRMTVQDPEEQRLLDKHRAEKQRKLREKKEQELEQEHRLREVRHKNTEGRVLAAGAPVLGVELFLAVLVGIVFLFSFYYGVGWLDSFADRGPEITVFGVPQEESEGAGWVGFLREQAARVPPWAIPWRFPVGVFLGTLVGFLTLRALSLGRRRQYALEEDDLLGIYRPHPQEEGRILWSNQETDLEGVSRESAERFWDGLVRVVSAPVRALIFVGRGAGMDEWPWFGILGRFALAGLSCVLLLLLFVEWTGVAGLIGDRWAYIFAIVGAFVVLVVGIFTLDKDR